MIKKIELRYKKNIYLLFMLSGTILIISSLVLIYCLNLKTLEKKEMAIQLEKNFEQEVFIAENDSGDLKQENLSHEIKVDDSMSLNKFDSSAIGILRIDKINIVLPIFDKINKETLSDGVGILENTDFITSEKNKITVLAGHRGGKNNANSFLNIDKLGNGDEIKITTRENIFCYKITGQEIIKSTDWTKFIRENDKTKLFLMTCHPYPKNYQRLLIKSELKSYDTMAYKILSD